MVDMYTGATSGTFRGGAVDQRKEIANEAREKRANLTPAYELFVEELEKLNEQSRQIVIDLVADSATPDEAMRIEVLAQRRFQKLCQDLTANMKSIAGRKK